MDKFTKVIIVHIINVISIFFFTIIAAMLVCEGCWLPGAIVYVMAWLFLPAKVSEEELNG